MRNYYILALLLLPTASVVADEATPVGRLRDLLEFPGRVQQMELHADASVIIRDGVPHQCGASIEILKSPGSYYYSYDSPCAEHSSFQLLHLAGKWYFANTAARTVTVSEELHRVGLSAPILDPVTLPQFIIVGELDATAAAVATTDASSLLGNVTLVRGDRVGEELRVLLTAETREGEERHEAIFGAGNRVAPRRVREFETGFPAVEPKFEARAFARFGAVEIPSAMTYGIYSLSLRLPESRVGGDFSEDRFALKGIESDYRIMIRRNDIVAVVPRGDIAGAIAGAIPAQGVESLAPADFWLLPTEEYHVTVAAGAPPIETRRSEYVELFGRSPQSVSAQMVQAAEGGGCVVTYYEFASPADAMQALAAAGARARQMKPLDRFLIHFAGDRELAAVLWDAIVARAADGTVGEQ